MTAVTEFAIMKVSNIEFILLYKLSCNKILRIGPLIRSIELEHH